jgi:transposase
MASITVDIDLPPGVRLGEYHRLPGGHGFEVAWPLPERICCVRCHRAEQAYLEYKKTVQVVRDLDILGEPSFWVYQPAFHRCPWCGHRQHVLAPFKRRDTSYSYRFEEQVLRLLIGSNEEEVGRRAGVSAETVALIVRNQLADAKDKQVEPERVITDVGIDELSLKKRHKLYVTILTDLSQPEQPKVLAMAPGRDEAAARACLEKLTPAQRQGVRTYRADMGQAFHNACAALLPQAQAVIDRFHVAKLLGEAVDRERKKNHAWLQEETDARTTPGVPVADVGIPAFAAGPDAAGETEVADAVRAVAAVRGVVPAAGAFPEDL